MAYKFSAASEKALIGIHPELQRLAREALKTSPIDFAVNEGLRSLAQQKKNVAKGVSKTLKSKHLTGHAVDLVPFVNGKKTFNWPPYYTLAAHIKSVAKRLKITVTWGGDWKSFKDGPHWELNPAKYPFKK